MIRMRGLKSSQEQDPHLLLRDTRTLLQRVRDFLSDPFYSTAVLLVLAAACFFLPATVEISFLIAMIIFIYVMTRRHTLPFRMPMHSQALDYNDPLPGTLRKPRKARGIYFFGNAKDANEELWFNNDDMRTHVLIFGSTGSGKTETLISLAYNALLQGSGFIYVDGKGDNSLFAKLFSMVRSMGREDDFLLINFMTGAKDIVGPQERRLSNTMNPFAKGSSSMLSQLVVSLMDSSGGGGNADSDMWKGRAINFVEALLRILVYMRDQGHILLDVNAVRQYFQLPRLESIVLDRVFERDGGLDPINIADIPDTIIEPMINYINNLPGYDKSNKHKQVSQVLEQHGFITMQLTRVFGSLADTYGHILRTNLAEVDLHDVVLNRRILVVLLPALEKSPDELANLGKVIIASLKAMMAAGLGDRIEGDYAEVIERKPTNAETPYLCILDEYGYYAVKGFAVVPAQARSLGFSTVFAGQDLPAFQKASKEEAASIGANTNIKICMKLEDPTETWDFFQKTAGEAYVTKVDAFQTNAQSVLNNYLDTRSASAEKRARIDLLDLKEQREGEMHIFFKATIIRAKSFYAAPKPVKRMRLNQFLRVEPPDEQILLAYEKSRHDFEQSIETFVLPTPDESEEIEFISNHFNNNTEQQGIDKGVAALLDYYNKENEAFIEEEDEKPEDELLETDELNIFVSLRLTEITREDVLSSDFDRFSQAILDRHFTRKQSEYLSRILGETSKQSAEIGESLVRDMQSATHYPPEIDVPPNIEETVAAINTLCTHIDEKLQANNDEDE